MELLRLAVVYTHLVACCFAIGSIVIVNIAALRRTLKGGIAGLDQTMHFDSLKRTASIALAVLWITGTALICFDVNAKGWEVLANPKLQAKLGVVVLLTLNGFVLHRAVLPAIKRAGSLLRLAFGQRVLAVSAGAISAVSWFYAAMLSDGRPLSWKYTLIELLAAHPVLVAGGATLMLALTSAAQKRTGLNFVHYPSVSILPNTSLHAQQSRG